MSDYLKVIEFFQVAQILKCVSHDKYAALNSMDSVSILVYA